METKGLEEFKDIGGCWGCGLQLQLNQDIKDIKNLKQENEKLKEENKELKELLEEQAEIIQCKTGTIVTLATTRDRLKERIKQLSRENYMK